MGVGDDVAPRFTQKPALRQEDGGKRLVFQCVLEASPKPDISWARGTTALSSSDRILMRVDSAGGSAYNVILEIVGVTQADAGTYKVTAKNRLGEVSASINLNFSAGQQKQADGIAPNFVQKPVTRQENNGQKLLFECLLTADPAPAITWFKDNAGIAPGGRYAVRTEPRDNKSYFLVLEINGVNAQDAGNYKVTAKNALGESNATIRLNFDTSEANQVKGARPVFLQKPAIRQEGDKIVLECKLTADPKPTVSWSLNNKPISFGPDSRLTPKLWSEGSSHTLTLEIAKVAMGDAGEYRAHAKNDLGEATATITLNFEGAKKPQIPEGKAPHFTQKPTIKQQQSLLIMTCLLEANPTPQIRWFRDTTEVGPGGRYTITLTRNPDGPDLYTAILQIKDPKTEDGGTYKCTAANDFGESNANITLNFAAPGEIDDDHIYSFMTVGSNQAKPGGQAPAFKEKPKVVQDVKTINITCQCTASPKPTFTWMKGASPLQASARVVPTVTEEGNVYNLKLQILNFTKDDGGQYKVTAKNELGEGSANISINLEPPKEEPPQPDGKPTIRLDDSGKTVILTQAVNSPTKPTGLWYFGNQPITPGSRYIVETVQEGNMYYVVLKIPNFTEKDSGTYKLVMKNKGGETTTTVPLDCEALKPKPKGEAPKITQKLAPKSVNDGDAVDFVAKVTGTEPLDITWAKDGKPLAASNIHKITYDKGTCRLYIPEVFPEDSGNYTMTVKNQVGNASSMASLQVKEVKPEPKQDAKKAPKPEEIKPQTKPGDKQKQSPEEQNQAPPKKEPEPAAANNVPPKKDEPAPKKPEPAAQKKDDRKLSTPSIVVDQDKNDEGKAARKNSAGNPGGDKNPGHNNKDVVNPDNPGNPGNPSKAKAGNPGSKKAGKPKSAKDRSSSPEDGDTNGDKKDKDKKSKGKQKAYVKQPTTILEDEEGDEDEDEDGYQADKEGTRGAQPDDEDMMDDGKVSVDKGGAPVVGGDGPFFKVKPSNQVVVEGQTMKMNIEVALDGKPMPTVKYLRAGREMRDDSRIAIRHDKVAGKSTLEIKKTRQTDDAKYTVNLEQDGVITDTATFSVFVKDPKDSNLDFRALLKHRDQKGKDGGEEDPDWGSLKPVDKKGRRLSQIEMMKMSLKKVEKADSDSEDEKKRAALKEKERKEQEEREAREKEGSRRQSLEPDSIPIKKVSADKLEAMEQQRRASMQSRRTSLAEAIPDWPTLQKRIVQREEPDKFSQDLTDVKVMEGDKVEFVADFCKPNAKLRWFKNKLEIFHGHKYHFLNDDTEYKLVIPKAKLEDGGKYTLECNGVTSSAWLYVDAKEPEYYFTQKLPDKYEIERKKTGNLECFVSDPRAFIKWYRNGELLEYTPGKYEISRRENRCILRVVNAQPDDMAEFTCKCGEAGTTTKLIVAEPEWEFMKKLDDVEAVEREKAIFECDVSDSEADVTWWRGEKELKSGGKFEFLKDGLKRRLQIKNCSSKDDGKYTCKMLKQETTAELYVEPDVKFIKKLSDKKIKEGEQVVLDVKATNPHKHPVKWMMDGKPLPDNIRYEVTQKGELYKLTIKNADFGDGGEFSLEIGERHTRCKLDVEPLPRPPVFDIGKIPKEIFVKEGENINLEIPYDGAPLPRAQWSKNGEALNEANLDTETVPKLTTLRIPGAKRGDAGQYELTLSNDAGTAKVPIKITVMGPPSAPNGPLDVMDIYADRCALLWDKPKDDGGSPIKHYTVEKCDDATGVWEKVCETDDLEIDVSDLTPGHKYQFRVAAVNEEGQSEFLSTTAPILAKDPWDPTTAPLNPDILDYDKDYVEVEFDPPEKENGAPVQGYVIEYREKGDKEWKKGVETNSPDPKGTVEGLQEGKEYEFRAMAKNKAGLSEPSAPSPSIVTKARKVKPRIDQQSLPKNVKVKVGQKFQLPVSFIGEPNPTVTWVVKNLDLDTGLKMEEKPLEHTDTIKIHNEPKLSTVDCISGVRKDTGEYIVTVANKHGSDTANISVVVLGPPTMPGGPLVAKDVTKDSAVLTWEKPKDDGGNEIDGYVVEKFDMDKGKWEKVADVQGTKCSVPKLQEGHEYKFRVIAKNKNGDSDPLVTENPITAKNPFDEPHPPSQPEVVDRDRTFIELKWEPPSNDGGAPITGYDIERKEPKTNRWTKINKSPLQNCSFKDDKVKAEQEYEYRVVAQNEAGPSEPSLPTKPIPARPIKETPKLNLDSLFGAKEIRVRAGEPLNIALGVSGTPDPTVEWLKDGVPVGNRAQTTNNEKEAKLNVAKAERGDTGKYTVKVKNPHGEDTADINVIVLDKPGAPEGPIEASDIWAEQMKISWKPPKDNGGAEISGYIVEKQEDLTNTWEKCPGIITATNYTVKGLKDGKGYKFRVKAENLYGVSEPLEGSRVIAKNPFDTPDAPRDLQIPKFDRFSANLTWKEPLSDGGNPISGYLVEKRERNKDWVKASAFPVKATNFTVLNLKEGSVVEFRVSAVNDGGPGKPSIATPPHTVRDQIFPAGAPNQPKVDKITKHAVDLSWTRPASDGGAKLTGYVIEKKKKGEDWQECAHVPANATSASVTGLKEGEEYEFRVRAENAAGLGEPSKPTNSITAADQPEKPKLDMSRIKDITVKAGQEFQIPIPFTGVPKPTAKWELNGNDLEVSPRVSSKLDADKVILAVAKAKREDTGKYTITLKNDSGTETGRVNVNVLDKPTPPKGPLVASDIDGETLTLSWQPPKDDGGEPIGNYIVEKRKAGTGRWTKVSSFCHSPTCQVRNLEPGTKYEFRVAAENSQGISEALETEEAVLAKYPFDAAQAPSTPKCLAHTEDSITLEWNPPRNDGGSPVYGYVLEKREKGDKKWTKANVQEIPDTEYTVKGLQEGKEYEFRVAAINAAGPGEFSEGSGAIKAAPAPVAPKIGRDMMGAGKDIKAKVGQEFKIAIPFSANPTPSAIWTQGGLTVHPTDRFKLEVQKDQAVLICKRAEKTDTGKFSVTLQNDKGQDTCSVNVTVFDSPSKPEGPLDISDVTPDGCILKWSPPLEDGGKPITNYVVEKQDLRTGTWEPVSKFVRNSPFEVMGLTENHEYNFRVMAENEFGLSEPLESAFSIAAQYPYSAPGGPGSVKVDDVDEDSVSLVWTKPKNDGGKKVVGYVIEYKEPDSNRWKTYNDIPIKELRATVQGLSKDKAYEFRVKAKNSAGLGDPSDPTDPVHVKPKYNKPGPAGVPEAGKIGRTFVELKWDKPRHDGGAKVTGYIVEKKEKGMSMWTKANDFNVTDNNFTVSNLAENSEYEFRIIACNAAGNGEPSLPCAPIKIKEKIEGHAPDFIKKLRNEKGALGGAVAFSVEYDGKPRPEVLWFKNGIEVGSAGRTRIKHDGDMCTLYIDELYEKDAGEITCELVSPFGRETCKAKLDVQVPPKLEKDIRDQAVEKGDQFKLKIPFSGTGPLAFKLKRDGKELKEGEHIKISPFDDYVTLTIKDCDLDDSGKYELEICNESGSCTAAFGLKVKSPPGPPTGPLNVSDITKSACKLSWKPPKVDGGSRLKGYQVERQEVGKPYWVTVASCCKDTNIDIQGLYDNHQYKFRVAGVNENGFGDFLEMDSHITAKMPFDAPDMPGMPEVAEVGGDFVSLTWDKPKTDGGGRITGYWVEKREHGTDNWSKVNLQPCITNMINIPNLIEDRRYEFRVFAENESGMSKPSMASNSVKIKDPNAAVVPEFTSGLRKVQAVQGKSARFECVVSGQPKPDIQWLKGSRELTDSNKFEIFSEGDTQVLVVHDVYGEDADEYVCRASNKGGNRTSRADLEISSPPKINVPPRFRDVCTFEKGENVVLKIPFTGHPKPTVKWIRDGEELRGSRFHTEVTDRHAILTIKDASKADDGPLRLQLENNLGSDSAVLKIQINDRPDPPRFPVIENIRDDSVVLSWKPPLNDGGSFITSYVIEKREEPSKNWLRVGATRFAFHNVTGLSPNKEYQFRVIAENFYGRSDPCETPDTIKTEDPDAIKKKKLGEDEFGRKVRGKYDGPKINDYDKFFDDIWKKFVPQPVEVKQGSVYDYYDILEELGSGAFGVVHRCIEKATGRTFVAKFINTPYPCDKHTVKNEINIMNHLHHPKLINLHDAFEDKHEMTLILEFLSGGELFDRIAAEDYKMSEAEVINYMRQVCEGLKHMHENSIVHLDIKPENIMCETNKAANVKIIDFGLATKLNPDEIVKVTTATAEFAAPEIVEREPVGFYTDMWAVGVLAYVLLSGLSPFAGEDDLDTLQNVKRCDWEFDEDAFSNVSTEGKEFIRSLLQKMPPKRMTVHESLEHPWLKGDHSNLTNRIPSSRYSKIRQKIKDKYADWPQPMPAIGRIANFSSLRKQRPKEFQIYDTYFDRKEAVPRFVRKPRNQVAVEGQFAKFDCKIIAASAPIVSWFHNEGALSQSYKHMQKYMGKEYELKVSRIKMDDKGEYIVRAENSFGRKEERAKLQVEPGVDSRMTPSRENTPARKKRIFEEKQFEKPKEDAPPAFGFELRPRFIQAGSEFKLICEVMAHPPPKVTWTKDNKELHDGDHYNITYSHGVCSLEVSNSRASDTGRYVCKAINSLGEQETGCKVTVEERALYIPKETKSGVSRMVRRTKSDVKIEEDSYGSTSTTRKSRRTEIEEESYSSSRSEKKTVKSSTSSSSSVRTSTSSSTRTEQRSEEESPKFTEQLSPVDVNEGEKLVLEVSFSGKPDPNIEWFQNGQLLQSDDIVMIKTRGSSSRLMVEETVQDDEGEYVCKATNTAGVATTKTNVTIKVAKKAAPAKEPEAVEAPKETPAEKSTAAESPRFLEHLQGQSVTDGDEVTLQCRISGKPEIQWLANGKTIEDSDDFKYQNAGDIYKLIIGEIFPDDAGIYSCVATNAGGSASSSATIFVKVPDEEATGPVFTTWPQSLNVEEGSPLTFSATLDSPSELTVSWSKDGRPVEDGGRFKFSQEGKSVSLTIPAALSTDSGTYCVTAKCAEGSASWSCSLAVAIGEGGDVAK
ncbi:twitchin-like isoform X4 [Littorina saxatilis]